MPVTIRYCWFLRVGVDPQIGRDIASEMGSYHVRAVIQYPALQIARDEVQAEDPFHAVRNRSRGDGKSLAAIGGHGVQRYLEPRLAFRLPRQRQPGTDEHTDAHKQAKREPGSETDP